MPLWVYARIEVLNRIEAKFEASWLIGLPIGFANVSSIFDSSRWPPWSLRELGSLCEPCRRCRLWLDLREKNIRLVFEVRKEKSLQNEVGLKRTKQIAAWNGRWFGSQPKCSSRMCRVVAVFEAAIRNSRTKLKLSKKNMANIRAIFR